MKRVGCFHHKFVSKPWKKTALRKVKEEYIRLSKVSQTNSSLSCSQDNI